MYGFSLVVLALLCIHGRLASSEEAAGHRRISPKELVMQAKRSCHSNPLSRSPHLSMVLDWARRNHFPSEEGSIDAVPFQVCFYTRFMELLDNPVVCETGFNLGLSSSLWLGANRNSTVYSFDLGRHSYGRRAAAFLNSVFQNRLTVTWGDSSKTISQFRRAHPNVKCDVISVDGGHLIANAYGDLVGFARPDWHVGFFDDTPCRQRMCMGTMFAIAKGFRTEIVHSIITQYSSRMADRGFTVFIFSVERNVSSMPVNSRHDAF
eukprot:TRINITY_DN10207_c0_g1_i1.p1 TRINITY_DN10207_c0_g1~~TRINITY_DN10207_c0_g1_i1.p1  ORF type:complete len:271 (+),score=32.54 TRINITY_DN10207_c0_g1_i1:23-814(+)